MVFKLTTQKTNSLILLINNLLILVYFDSLIHLHFYKPRQNDGSIGYEVSEIIEIVLVGATLLHVTFLKNIFG